MSQAPMITPKAALLRVLITGESDGPDIVRKMRDWTDGQIQLDDLGFVATIAELEQAGLVERRSGSPDKRSGQPRATFVLTATGRSQAMEILAASLTRKA